MTDTARNVQLVWSEMEALQAKYADRYNKDHTKYLLSDWRNAVVYDHTRLGYWDWVMDELQKAKQAKEEALKASIITKPTSELQSIVDEFASLNPNV